MQNAPALGSNHFSGQQLNQCLLSIYHCPHILEQSAALSISLRKNAHQVQWSQSDIASCKLISYAFASCRHEVDLTLISGAAYSFCRNRFEFPAGDCFSSGSKWVTRAAARCRGFASIRSADGGGSAALRHDALLSLSHAI